MNNQKETIERLMQISKQAQFVSFTYRAKGTQELARHTLIFGGSYQKQVEQSLLALELLMPTFTRQVEIIAAKELEQSFKDTLAAFAKGEYNWRYTKPESYVTICNGMKYNIANRSINVSGLAHKKVVIEPGQEQGLTSPKSQIRLQLPVGRWREFIVLPENLQSARLQGVELILN